MRMQIFAAAMIVMAVAHGARAAPPGHNQPAAPLLFQNPVIADAGDLGPFPQDGRLALPRDLRTTPWVPERVLPTQELAWQQVPFGPTNCPGENEPELAPQNEEVAWFDVGSIGTAVVQMLMEAAMAIGSFFARRRSLIA